MPRLRRGFVLFTHRCNGISGISCIVVDFPLILFYYYSNSIKDIKGLLQPFQFYRIRRCADMHLKRSMEIIIAAATIILAVAGAVTYLLYRDSREKAYKEKWEDYIDCGLA